MKEKMSKILLWIFFTFGILCAIGIGPNFFGILMLASAIMSMPIIPIQNLWSKMLKVKNLKTILIVSTFFVSLVGYFLTLPNEKIEIPSSNITFDTTAPETTVPETTVPETTAPETTAPETTSIEYVLSLDTQKFHHKNCRWVEKIKDENRGTFSGSKATLISQGYTPCGTCKP